MSDPSPPEPPDADDPGPPAARRGTDEHDAEHVWSQRQVVTMVRWLLYLVFVVIGYTILRRLAPVLTPLLAAAAVGYLLDPLVDRLVARGVKRVWAVTLLLVAFLGAVTAAILVLAPLLVGDLARFVSKFPDMIDNAARWVSERWGYELPASWQEIDSEQASAVVEKAIGPASGIVLAAVGGLLSLLGFLAELLLIPVFAFYILLDWDHIVARVRRLIPPRHRVQVTDLVLDIDRVVSGWIRGQLTVTTVLAVLYAVCFYAIEVPLAVPVGLAVGALTIIPFLGTFVGAAITLVLILLDWQGAGQLGAVGAVFVLLHLIEAAVLTPKLVGKRVGLGELGALFAVLAGGKLLGLTGVLLAVPLAASVAVLVRRAVGYYERSRFFDDDGPGAPAAAAPADDVVVTAARVAISARAGAPASASATTDAGAPAAPPDTPASAPLDAPDDGAAGAAGDSDGGDSDGGDSDDGGGGDDDGAGASK